MWKKQCLLCDDLLEPFPQDPISNLPRRVFGDTTSSYSVSSLRKKRLQVARRGATDAMLHPKANFAEPLISRGIVLPLHDVFDNETSDPGYGQ